MSLVKVKRVRYGVRLGTSLNFNFEFYRSRKTTFRNLKQSIWIRSKIKVKTTMKMMKSEEKIFNKTIER